MISLDLSSIIQPIKYSINPILGSLGELRLSAGTNVQAWCLKIINIP